MVGSGPMRKSSASPTAAAPRPEALVLKGDRISFRFPEGVFSGGVTDARRQYRNVTFDDGDRLKLNLSAERQGRDGAPAELEEGQWCFVQQQRRVEAAAGAAKGSARRTVGGGARSKSPARRAEAAAAAAAAAPGTEGTGARPGTAMLLTWDETPQWIRDNEIIWGGFRPSGQRNWLACVRSAFSLHNETTNIWTHFLGFLAFAHLFRQLFATTLPEHPAGVLDEDYFPWRAFAFGSLACAGASTIFHTFMNFSDVHFRRLLVLDYMGIVAQIWGGQMMATHYLLACFPAWRAPLQAACTAAGLGTFAIMLIPRLMGPAYRTFRAVLFASFAACAAVPVVIYGARVVPGCAPCWRIFSRVVTRVLGSYACAVLLYASRFPERHFPRSARRGDFNVWVHSHMLMHVFCNLGVLSIYYGFLDAHGYVRGPEHTCPAVSS